jgi:uncharacterized membrane protein
MRLHSLDIARGLAIVMMGQYHFMRWFVNESLLPSCLHSFIFVFGKLSAPFFIMISGVGAMMLYENYRLKGKTDYGIFVTTLKRGVFLIVLTIPLNMAAKLLFDSGDIWEWNIFQLLGVVMVGTFFWGRFGIISIIISFIGVYFFGNILPSGNFLNTGIAPLIPWLNYYLIGCLIGRMLIFNTNRIWFKKLIIFGTISFCLASIFFILDPNQIIFLVGHTQRLEILSMIIISLFFVGLLFAIESSLHHDLFFIKWFQNFGYIPLSVYYFHLFYKYSLVILLSVIGLKTDTWGVVYWVMLNVLFWGLSFVFVNKVWVNNGFKYGVEYFMSRYVSQKTNFR